MAKQISSHLKDKNSIFTARYEDKIFLVKGKILVFHQYLYNKIIYPPACNIIILSFLTERRPQLRLGVRNASSDTLTIRITKTGRGKYRFFVCFEDCETAF